MSDSLARWLRSVAFMVAGGALQPLFDQFLLDLDDKWDPYAIVIWGLVINGVVLLVEQWRGTGIARAPLPESITQIKEPIK